MAFNLLANLRKNFGLLESQVDNDLVNDCLSSSYREILREISQDFIAKAIANTTDEEKLIRDNLTEAEGYLTVGKIVQRTGLQIRQGGLIIQEQDGSSGMTTGRTVVNEYLSPEKIERYALSFFSKARPLLALYANEAGQIDIGGFIHNFSTDNPNQNPFENIGDEWNSSEW